jgi:hypothetical protein
MMMPKRRASEHRPAHILTAILFLLPFNGAVEGQTSHRCLPQESVAERQSDDCTTIVMIVDGMMKSRSGAT